MPAVAAHGTVGVTLWLGNIMTDDQHTPPPAPAPEPAPSYPAPAPKEGNGMGVASLVLGILSILLGWIPIIGFVSWILAPLGLIFGFIALGKTNKGLAIGGLITSGIGLLICIAWVTFLGAIINQAQREGAFDNLPTAASSAEINTDGATTTITTPESTTTVTTAPNDAGATGDDAADDGAGHTGLSEPPSN